MNILAVDTSTKRASVAVQNTEKIVSENILNEITHSEKLLPLIDKVLNDSNLNIKEIDMLACTNGPGSFTGVRIGLSTMKAIAHVSKKNIFSMPTLLLLAYTEYLKISDTKKSKDIYICPMLDAKNTRVYYSIYKFKKVENKFSVETIVNISNDTLDDALENINNLNLPCTFTGDCITKYSNDILEYFKNVDIEIICSDSDIFPDSQDIISYINNVFDTNIYMYDYASLDAIYARVSQAERN